MFRTPKPLCERSEDFINYFRERILPSLSKLELSNAVKQYYRLCMNHRNRTMNFKIINKNKIIENFKNNCYELIGFHKISETLDFIDKVLKPDSMARIQIVLLKSRYSKHKNDTMLGIKSQEELDTQIDRITESLLMTILSIKEDEITTATNPCLLPTPPNS